MPGKTGEIVSGGEIITRGFNEAPAKCRGKLGDRGIRRRGCRASMRPQRNAGENEGISSVEERLSYKLQ